MSKHKLTKQKQSTQDKEDNRKFLIVLAVATIALMLVMYFAFTR
jgi:cytochrome c-type biogenesis protein CcmH/NrfG